MFNSLGKQMPVIASCASAFNISCVHYFINLNSYAKT